MNIGEANDAQALLRHVLRAEHTRAEHREARAAAVRLAERSRKALGAEMSGADVGRAWDARRLPPRFGCPCCEVPVGVVPVEPAREVVDVPVSGGVL